MAFLLAIVVACGDGDDGGSGNGNGNGNGASNGTSVSPGVTVGPGTPQPASTGDAFPTIPGDQPGTREPTAAMPTLAPIPPAEASEVTAAVDQAISAFNAGDAAAVRAMASPRLAEEIDEDMAELDQFLACWPDGTLAPNRLGELDVNDNRARQRMNFTIVRSGDTRIVDRIWEFEWDGARWRLHRIPPCPPN